MSEHGADRAEASRPAPEQPGGIKIIYQMLSVCLAMIIIVGCGISFYLVPLFHEELLDNERTHIRDLVESAYSVATNYYERSVNGEFSEQDARRRALERIRQMRYGDSGYFWVNDMKGTMVMHPVMPELNGRDMYDFTDFTGKYLFREFVDVARREGRGYISYRWPEPGVDQPVEKTSHVKLFKPWGWVIGTGVYTTEIQRSLASMHKELLVATIVLLVVLAVSTMLIALRIAEPVNRLAQFSNRLRDDLTIRIEPEGAYELQCLAIALNTTSERLSDTLVSRDRLDAALASLTALQEQIIRSEKMSSVGQLAAGMAHEINNPAGFINSNLSTLRRYVGRLAEFIEYLTHHIANEASDNALQNTGEKRNLLKIDRILTDSLMLIEESLEGIERVKRIVADLMSFSRADSGIVSAVDINEALESAINVASSEIRQKATLVREYGTLPEVVCCPQQIGRVFVNILVNAAQALEEKGRITVKTWCQEKSVCISIADTGIGMDPETMRRIFDPFFTSKEVGSGTGLGLYIAYDIIRKHGGDITVQSEPCGGSTFTVSLPAARPLPDPEA